MGWGVGGDVSITAVKSFKFFGNCTNNLYGSVTASTSFLPYFCGKYNYIKSSSIFLLIVIYLTFLLHIKFKGRKRRQIDILKDL